MPSITFGTVIRLLIWSLVVGATLAFFDITPHEVVGWISTFAQTVVNDLQTYAGRLVAWTLLGAVVVVPIWLVYYLTRVMKRR